MPETPNQAAAYLATLTIPGATVAGADTTHSFSCAAGDKVSVKVVGSASSAAEDALVSFLLTRT